MRRVVAVANQKGGVAKTTSVLNLGTALAQNGKKVLLIDLDPQSNLTESCGHSPAEIKDSMWNVLLDGACLRDIIIKRYPDPDLAPATEDLVGAEVELVHLDNKNFRLKEAIARIRGYNYILIDCPPTLGQLTINAICAAGEIMIPVQAEFFALHGLKKMIKTIEGIKADLNTEPKISGIFVTRYSGHKILNRGVLDQLQAHFGDKLFRTTIRENISVAEAQAAGLDIFKFRGASYGAKDYKGLATEIIMQEKK